MAITSGFYNAVNHDRLYNAEDFGFAMSLAVKNGVDAEYKDKFEVTPATGLQVSVGEGRAWFSDKWIKNSGAITLGLNPASTNLNRIDAVVIDIQGGDDYREADVIILTGTPASTPVAPSLILSDSDKHWQYALAYVTVRAGAVNILSSDIQDNRGTEATPYIAKMGDFDNQLDLTSSNAVQNKIVTKAIVDLEDNVSAYEENGTSASKAYTTGQYIRRKGVLYKVIANIASGAAFTVDTNIQAVTIGSEITEINSNLLDKISNSVPITVDISHGDANTVQALLSSGWDVANVPVGRMGVVILTLPYLNATLPNYAAQICIAVEGVYMGYRYKNAGVWSDWFFIR